MIFKTKTPHVCEVLYNLFQYKFYNKYLDICQYIYYFFEVKTIKAFYSMFWKCGLIIHRVTMLQMAYKNVLHLANYNFLPMEKKPLYILW